jgi:uncharacterized protein with PIN domain
LFTVRVHDASLERKTAENFLRELEKTVDIVQNEWGSPVIAVVTDASGECRKARREFGRKYPWIVVLDCYAHQVSKHAGLQSCIELVITLRRLT